MLYQRLFCGNCRHCLGGRQDLCRNSRVLGEHGSGGYTELPACRRERDPGAGRARPDRRGARGLPGPHQRTRHAWRRATGPGDTVLITGAGGGLGLHQIQVAKSVQALVIAVTSSGDKADVIRRAGADEIIISPNLKFSGECDLPSRAPTYPGNVVTGTFAESLRSAAQLAAVVVLGNIGAKPVEIDPGFVIMRAFASPAPAMPTFNDVHMALHLSPPAW